MVHRTSEPNRPLSDAFESHNELVLIEVNVKSTLRALMCTDNDRHGGHGRVGIDLTRYAGGALCVTGPG